MRNPLSKTLQNKERGCREFTQDHHGLATIPNRNIISNTDYTLDYVQGRYIPAVRNYLHKIQAKIEIQPNFIPDPLRQKDKTTIEMTAEMQMTQKQRTRLNCVRMYLGITWLSKICTLNGKYIQPHILQYKRDETEYTPKKGKPYEPKPNTHNWKILKRIISGITETDNRTLTKEHRVHHWTKHHSNSGTWNAYMNQHRTIA